MVKQKEILNKDKMEEVRKNTFVEYNYGDVHRITPVISKHIDECVTECNKVLGHSTEVLDFVRGTNYALQGLIMAIAEKKTKDMTKEQSDFITKRASDSVDSFLKDYVEKFSYEPALLMQFPFLALDSMSYKLFSVNKAIKAQQELDKKNNETA